jgi:hypothetical protein
MIINIYRPSPSSVNNLRLSDFLDEFDSLLDEVSSVANKLIMFGDINVHVNKPDKSDVKQFLDALCTYGFMQHVDKPTHILGNTLDHIISRINEDIIVNWDVEIPPFSDHFIVMCKLDYVKPSAPKVSRTLRNFRGFDNDMFSIELNRGLSNIPTIGDVNDVVSKYTEICTKLLDTHAPFTTKSVSACSRLPWYNEEIGDEKCLRRRLERKWRKSGCAHDRSTYLNQV